MALFTSISVELIKGGLKEEKSSEGVDVYSVASACRVCDPAIPVLLMIDKDSDNAAFVKALAEKADEGKRIRVLVSGVLQSVYAQKDDKTKQILKGPKLIVYVGAVRRLRADDKIDPEQAVVFGSGFVQVVTDFHDKTKRKAELLISTGTQDLKEEGKYSSRMQIIGDTKTKTDEACMRVDDGKEVYFMANLFRSKGEMNGTEYDKIKASATFLEEGDRVKSRKSGRNNHAANMTSQLSDTFEESEGEEDAKSVNELAQAAGIALGDF